MNRRSFNALVPGLVVLPHMEIQASAQKSKIKERGFLKKGDKIGVIAPAGPVAEERFAYVAQNLEVLGLKAVYGQSVQAKNGYLAGTDAQRLADFNQMFEDPEIAAVWCVRGGYGTTRILDDIDFRFIRRNAKPLIGYSDITALHMALYHKSGVPGYHATMLASRWSLFTAEMTRKVLFAEESEFVFDGIGEGVREDGESAYTITEGTASGHLLGGNLCLVAALSGTHYLPSFKNAIVFLEDVGEEPYRLDRMLTQLKQATDIREAAGFVLGIFNDCQPKNPESSIGLRQLLEEQFRDMGKPTYYGAPFGHIDLIAPLPMGARASINASEKKLMLHLTK